MTSPTTVIYESDHARFVTVLDRLRRDSSSKFAFLLDKNGQQIATSGELDGTDATALASLTAGNVAATEGLAQLIGESAFSSLFHEGVEDSLLISLVSNKVILLMIFDEHSSLGLVRLRVKQRMGELEQVVGMMNSRSKAPAPSAAAAAADLGEITDEDIDALFG